MSERPLPGFRAYVLIWAGLLLIVASEVALTLARPATSVLLPLLLLLAFLEAGLAVLYFMHLRYEKRLLLWTLVPVLLFVLLMMNQFWFDAVRLRVLKP